MYIINVDHAFALYQQKEIRGQLLPTSRPLTNYEFEKLPMWLRQKKERI
jgi:hypothetical protein